MKKTALTPQAIAEDIAVFIKHRPKESEAGYRAATLPCLVIALLALVLWFFAPNFLVWPVVGVFVLAVACAIFFEVREKRRIKNIRPEDYEITCALLSHKEEEHYAQETARPFRRREVSRYLLHFEGGAVWDIPDKLYPWSEENKTGSYFIYENASRGAAYILVTEKKSGRVAVAYPEEFFTYERS